MLITSTFFTLSQMNITANLFKPMKSTTNRKKFQMPVLTFAVYCSAQD